MSDREGPPSYDELWAIICELQQRISKIERALDRTSPPAKPPPPPPPPRAVRPATPKPTPPRPAPPSPTAPPPRRFEPIKPSPPSWAPIAAPPPTEEEPSHARPAAPDSGLAGILRRFREDRGAAPPGKTKPKLTFEQWIGTRWLLIAGIVVLLIAGVFFYRYAYEKKWITPTIRVVSQALLGVIILSAGEWALRKKMRLFAAGLFGLGIVWLYHAVFVASPNGTYELLSTPTAFALMCAVTAAGVGLSLRSRIQLAAVIAMLGAFAAPAVLSTGENRQVFLMSYMLLVNAGFLALGIAMRWRVLGPLAVVCTAILFGGWYYKHYTSDAFAQTLAFGWAFAALLWAYGVAGILLRRVGTPLGGAVLLATVAALAALVTATAEDVSYLHPFAVQLLLVTGGVFVLGVWRKWEPLPLIATAAVVTVSAAWMGKHFESWATSPVCAYGWCLFALVWAVGQIERRPSAQRYHIATLAVAGSAMVVSWMAMQEHLSLAAYAGQLIAVNALVLGTCMLRRWNWLRSGVWAWTAAALFFGLFIRDFAAEQGPLVRAACVWAAFALLSADVLIRAWTRRLNTVEYLDASLGTLATGLMFAATYALLREDFRPWMGAYAAALGAATIVLAWVLHRIADRRKLSYAYLGQGLVLITLAMPIQFDFASVTVAWTIQAVVAMFLARRLRNKLLLIKVPIVLAAAIVHYVAVDLPHDPDTAIVLLSPGGVDIRYALMLAVGMTVGLLAAAAILRAGKELFDDGAEIALASLLVVAAAVLLGVMTWRELPAVAATWWWLAPAVGVGAVAVWRRSEWLWYWGYVLLLAVAVKWIGYDTLYRRMHFGPDTDMRVVLNWQVGAGVALTAAILLFIRMVYSRCIAARPVGHGLRISLGAAVLLAAMLIGWGGSFEIDRYFAGESGLQRWENPHLAVQMGYSLWWALYAAVILIVGFATSRASLRYLALIVFAVTLVKVLAKDMSGVEYIYRVLALGGVGAIFLVGSLLYHRYFRLPVSEEST